MRYQQHAIEQLKKKKYRITKPRQAVLEILETVKKPLNAYEIAEVAQKNGIHIDVSTVYRILEVYQELHLAHYVKDKQGYLGCKDWNCSNNKHCHHQFVCKSCENVVEIHVDDRSFIQKIQEKFCDLKIEGHYLELSGLCESCNN